MTVFKRGAFEVCEVTVSVVTGFGSPVSEKKAPWHAELDFETINYLLKSLRLVSANVTMPKKFQGENSKSAVARARKEAVQQAEREKVEREAEDAAWHDDDKHVARKQQRKECREKKKLEVAERKAVSKTMLEEEMQHIKFAKASQAAKVTRAQIIMTQDKQNDEKPKKPEPVQELPLEENINRLETDELDAHNVDEALSILSVKEDAVDRHPERRMKAAYQAFEDEHLPRLKAENPNLRLSQLKQMLKKDWMKSPENPLNKARYAET